MVLSNLESRSNLFDMPQKKTGIFENVTVFRQAWNEDVMIMEKKYRWYRQRCGTIFQNSALIVFHGLASLKPYS